MEKIYNAASIESHWRKQWEGYNYAQPSGEGTPYCIILPPPNVTGSLHMGHGFQMTLMDILIRYHRMSGDNTLWQVGTDHAGIATQMVVERQLEAAGQSRQELGREAFNKKVWEWRDLSGGTITEQMRRLGGSVDWTRECFSLDPNISEAVYTLFDKLYQDGLLYRDRRLVNWDPVLQTAISDLEVVNQTKAGHLWHIKYPLQDQDGFVVVATTRPETMFGDVAVAVHPEDPRYKHLIGSSVQLPLCDRTIPIIADEMVEQEFGSGCVKITPGHDFNDYEVGTRHKLPLISVLDKQACLNENAPKDYQGLDRFIARDKLIKQLTEQNLIEQIEDYQTTLPYGDRSGSVIEPLSTVQWFINMKPLTKPAIDALDNGDLSFHPDNWKNTYLHWLENIQDWCISRQLWWGHQIPAWYDADDNIYIGRNEEEVRQRYKLDPNISLKRDPDVLDTWFSAALWPFATLGWPEKTKSFEDFYPTQTLITGFDIIFFWVARMVMIGYYCTGCCPFKQVNITGLIRDHEGQKMSKSKGNVINPIDLIDGIDLPSLIKQRTSSMLQPQKAKAITKATKKQFPQGIPSFGTDALRFTFCALASTGRDIHFDLERITGYRNFCNKLWNAARYVLMQTENHPIQTKPMCEHFTVAEHWMLDRLHHVSARVKQHLERYRFDLLAQDLYELVWNHYCDWYIELSKVTLQNKQTPEATGQQVRTMLVYVLEVCLRLLHPIMPFITEDIWQQLGPMLGYEKNSIMLQPYPQAQDFASEIKKSHYMQQIQQMITAVRTIRSEMNIKPSQTISLIIKCDDPSWIKQFENDQNYLKTLAKVSDITWETNEKNIPPAAISALEHLTLYIPLAGLIDQKEEQIRLSKILQNIEKDMQKTQQKLDNKNYINKAPKDIVAAEQAKYKELTAKRDKIKDQISMLDEIEK